MAQFTRRASFRRAPRASFRRRRFPRVGTTPPRMQQANFNIDFDMFVAGVANGSAATPSFNIQAFTPWSNLSQSGYDRSLTIRGIVFQFDAFVLSFDTGAGEQVGLTSNARAFMPFHSWWFIDAYDKDTEAPVSYLNEPYGPFVTNPPITSPTAGTPDHTLLPQRILKRKFGRLKVGNAGSIGTQSGGNNDTGGFTRFQWSSVIRKRLSIDDKQGLYWAVHALSPFTAGNDLFVSCWLNGILYYTLRR